MKEEVNRRRATQVVEGCRSKIALSLFFIFFLGAINLSQGQCLQDARVLTPGEKVQFDVYFKWGILMTKGGGASITVREGSYEGAPAWNNELLLWTTGMIDKVFSIRDTIENHITKENQRLLFSTKRSDEGGYYQIDNLTYSYKGEETHVHAFRRNRTRIKADTTLIGGNCTLDILGALFYARSFDWNQMELSQQYHLQVAMGKTVIPISYRYEGQRIVERDNIKYSTRYFIIDIFDDAFTQSKEAMEIWIGDDPNHLPVKVRAKLKLGAMEAYYNSSENLRYPLTCRIEVPKK
ncbi:DUF3108 domain-containing protein [Parabacteroides sp. OttesenSCG-928-G06]|nr:DUF3108 domain-containing protein [Parabacteroides sp. OttesenSCG-928-K15]MDL2282448.1 DUF3108 domain-containing protein [Parabacteroides sp. OttesenSCG-928-G06]